VARHRHGWLRGTALQLRATMAAAIEALIVAQAGKGGAGMNDVIKFPGSSERERAVGGPTPIDVQSSIGRGTLGPVAVS
jgi:hypothetical protein